MSAPPPPYQPPEYECKGHYPPPGAAYPPPGAGYPPPGAAYPPPGARYPPPGAYPAQGYAPQPAYAPQMGYAPQPSYVPPPAVHSNVTNVTIGAPPAAAPTFIVAGAAAGCPMCHNNSFEDTYGCCAILFAICLFPFGILCCLSMKERKCSRCGYQIG